MLKRFAKLLCGYSLRLKPGDLFIIRSPLAAIPLARAVFCEALSYKTHPFIRILDEETEAKFIELAEEKQLDFASPYSDFETKKADALLTIWGNQNTNYLGGVDPKNISRARRAERELRDRFFQRMATGDLRWCGTLFPTHATAQDAGLAFHHYEDFVWKACMLDRPDPIAAWKEFAKSQETLVKRLAKAKIFKLHGKDTDLILNVTGRKWISAAGTENMPDGEVFTSPHETSAQGKIHFHYPSRFNGQLVSDIHLEFKDGKVTKAVAGQNQSFLDQMLDTDEGSRRLGEIAIGTNFGITRITGDTLFDEKIGGTVHAALGAAFPESGGKNKSVIHWDLIHSLKDGGRLEVDGKPIIVDGRFVDHKL